jgi:hypothetical protein
MNRAALLDDLASPGLCLTEVAARHGLTIEAHSTYLASNQAQETLDKLQSIAAIRTRLIAQICLPIALAALTTILQSHRAVTFTSPPAQQAVPLGASAQQPGPRLGSLQQAAPLSASAQQPGPRLGSLQETGPLSANIQQPGPFNTNAYQAAPAAAIARPRMILAMGPCRIQRTSCYDERCGPVVSARREPLSAPPKTAV